MTVPEWLKRAADRHGEAVALGSVDGEALSYRTLDAVTAALADRLTQAGVAPGDAVLITLPDGPDALIAILAAARVGAAFPVASHETDERHAALLDDVPIRAIICDSRKDHGRLESIARERGVAFFRLPAGPMADIAARLAGAASAPSVQASPRAPTTDDLALLIASSGTTAAPKVIGSSHASLFASISHCAEWLGLTENDRSLCVMPFSHVHAIVRSSLPGLVAGGQVIVAPGFDTHRVLDWITRLRPTYMTMAPSLYRTLLNRIAETGWRPEPPSLRLLVTGSDRIDAEMIARIEKQLGAPVVQFYGISEFAPLIAVTPTDAPDSPKDSVGRMNPVWQAATLNAAGEIQQPGIEGEVVLRGGYVNRIIGRDGTRSPAPDGYLPTGDLGHIDENGFLFITGRVGDRIHRGGEKIDPLSVEAVLQSHPAVDQVAVFGFPDPVLGQRVGAVVVPNAEHPANATALQEFAARKLFAHMVPERIVFADHLPRSATGKVSRSVMAATLGLASDTTHADAEQPRSEPGPRTPQIPPTVLPPADKTERGIWDLFCAHFKRTDIRRDDSFFDLGGDSIGAIDLLLQIEQTFGRGIPIASFLSANSIAALAAAIRTDTAEEKGLTLSALRAGGNRPPLFIPYGEAGQVGFAGALDNALGPEQPIYTFHQAGNAKDAASSEHFEDTAAAMIKLIKSVCPAGPYYLLGYSATAHHALEMAQQLLAGGDEVAFLGIVDDFADLERRRFNIENQRPGVLDRESRNRWAYERYIPKPYAGRITLFRASEPASAYLSDPSGGWAEIAQEGVEAFDINGDHASVVMTEGLRWGAILSLALAQARHRQGAGRSRVATGSRGRRKGPAKSRSPGARHTVEARIAAKRGDLKTEIAEYRKAIALADQPAWVHANLGRALLDDGNAEAGLAQLWSAVDLDPWPMWRMADLAGLLAHHDRSEGVTELYERARGLLADEADTMRHFGHICALAGRLDEAETAIRTAMRLESRQQFFHGYGGEMREYLAELLLSRGRAAEAAKLVTEALDLSPRSPPRLLRLAGKLEPAGFADEASRCRATALRLNAAGPQLVDAFLRRG